MASIRSSLKRVYYGAVSAVHRRAVPLHHSPPMVTFTFDDFPRSAYVSAGATLRAYGGHGTYYAAPGWMDGGPATGDRYRMADLHARWITKVDHIPRCAYPFLKPGSGLYSGFPTATIVTDPDTNLCYISAS